MATFRMTVAKGPQGEIQAYGNYVSGTEPVLVERVIIEELDATGNTMGSFVYHLNRSVDPTPGAYLLASKSPSGPNVKFARASAWYEVVDGFVRSDRLAL